MKAIIIEDEPMAAKKLVRMLNKANPEIEIIEILPSVKRSVEFLAKNNTPLDVIFADIHLEDGEGFDIFEALKVETPIIFTTAYDEYAIKAFKINSIDYLLKPINAKDLENALDQLESYNKRNANTDLQKLFNAVKGGDNKYRKRFLISNADTIKYIQVEDIAYFFADGKYNFIVDKNGEQNVVDLTLEKIIEMLDPDQFFRANRKCIVCIDAIEKMSVMSKSRISLTLHPAFSDAVVVSSERARLFKEWLNQ